VRLYRGGEGPPLLFLHDSFCPSWSPFHAKLAANYEVFLPIHPGFSGSEEKFDEFDEMEDLIFQYLDFCEVLHIDRPTLVGASFGGWIAAEWAVRYSGSLNSLILIDALGLRVPESPAADILSLDASATRQLIFAEPLAAAAVEAIPDAPKAEAIISTILARQAFARFAWQFPDDPRLQRYLYRVEIPTLILWGERDAYVPLAHGKAYNVGIANSKVITIPNSGHLPHIEAPEACAKIISEFLCGL